MNAMIPSAMIEQEFVGSKYARIYVDDPQCIEQDTFAVVAHKCI